MVEAVLLLDEARRRAEHLGRVLAVDGDRDRIGGRGAGEFDLEVEQAAGEDLRAVERIDGLRAGGKGGTESRQAGDREGAAHRMLLR